MSVDDVVDFALAFFLVIAVLGLAVRAWDHDSRWLDRPAAERMTD